MDLVVGVCPKTLTGTGDRSHLQRQLKSILKQATNRWGWFSNALKKKSDTLNLTPT
jgi:hypothetical protein